MQQVFKSLIKVYEKPYSWIVTISATISVLFIYYFIFLQTTTISRFFETNIGIYVWLEVILSFANALLIGISLSMFLAVWEIKQKSKNATLLTAGSFLFSAVVTGCPVCGAFLLPLFGISASLAAMPFGGIEVKLLTVVLLIYAIYEYSKTLMGTCPVIKNKIIEYKNGKLNFHINKLILNQQKPIFILIISVIFIYSLPYLPKQWRINFQKSGVSATIMPLSSTEINEQTINEQINPKQGYEINASYGNLGPELIKLGAINFDKFAQVFSKYNTSLTQDEINILTKGSNEKIKMTQDNAHFILDLFWAVGLSNNSKFLTQGQITQYGKGQIGNFASTGGWTIGNNDAVQYFAKANLISLTASQEAVLDSVAPNIYRPCCGNSTAFPDCNHGMALLGILELMAANNATADDMYKAAKYFNAYWFPSEYYQIAAYFKKNEEKDYKDIDPKILLSKDYSSVFGFQNIQQWLKNNNVNLNPPEDKVGCSV